MGPLSSAQGIGCLQVRNSQRNSRIFFIGAREDQLPRIVSMIHPEQLTPIPALLCTVSPVFRAQIQMEILGNTFNSVSVHRRRNVRSDELLHVRQLGLVCLRRRWTRLLALHEKRSRAADENKPHRPVLFHRSLPAATYFQVAFSRFLRLILFSIYSEPLQCLAGFAISLAGIPVYYAFIHYAKRYPEKYQVFMGESSMISADFRWKKKQP